jgi:hypothetical protein
MENCDTPRTTSAWETRRGSGSILVLGDESGQLQEIEGTLTARRVSPAYADNFLYDISTSDGESVTIAGTASLNARLTEHDIGRYVAITFKGWGATKRGNKFKDIDVRVRRDTVPF